MAIDIANPGGSAGDLKAALGTLIGQSVEGTGTVAAQTLCVIALDSDCDWFELDLKGIHGSTSGDLAFVMSTDGGATWHNADNDYDYAQWYFEGPSTELVSAASGDTVGDILPGGCPTVAPYINANLKIWNNDGTPYVCAEWITRVPGNSPGMRMFYNLSTCALIGKDAKATHIAFIPYGNGDYPPTSGDTVSFTYALRGIMP